MCVCGLNLKFSIMQMQAHTLALGATTVGTPCIYRGSHIRSLRMYAIITQLAGPHHCSYQTLFTSLAIATLLLYTSKQATCMHLDRYTAMHHIYGVVSNNI